MDNKVEWLIYCRPEVFANIRQLTVFISLRPFAFRIP
jgi:hypothetical protein